MHISSIGKEDYEPASLVGETRLKCPKGRRAPCGRSLRFGVWSNFLEIVQCTPPAHCTVVQLLENSAVHISAMLFPSRKQCGLASWKECCRHKVWNLWNGAHCRSLQCGFFHTLWRQVLAVKLVLLEPSPILEMQWCHRPCYCNILCQICSSVSSTIESNWRTGAINCNG